MITDDQLKEFGVSQRVIDLSRQPYLRPGAVNLDVPYMNSIIEAQIRIEFAQMCLKWPDQDHEYFEWRYTPGKPPYSVPWP
jgi:hypothetical protein